jgi:hypothetical protein
MGRISVISSALPAVELAEFFPYLRRAQGGFRIESTGGAVFDNVDLKEKEWCDYDDDAGLSVGVYDLEWKFEVKK